MESWLKVVWMLAIATVIGSASLPQNFLMVRDKVIALAIDLYNKDVPGYFVFKILKYDSKNITDMSFPIQQVKFRIKETVCQKSELGNIEECDFKENGLIKDCTAFFTEQNISTTCIAETAHLTSKRDGNQNGKEKEKEKEKEKKKEEGKEKENEDSKGNLNSENSSNHISCLSCIYCMITRSC
ncbi:cathelicidin-related peptide Na_CRAMP-like [Rhinatrema bivittatum]|uniref:cathelicidin-related peptide Na_CRAMP-like n=1 Tax=Rhinatrema bivittatum TaxID=194408 RepID=UPI00112B4369|nr:cathelicidin-related peptide Na_CRAMP-like [Rhinatrema bivittatum]